MAISKQILPIVCSSTKGKDTFMKYIKYFKNCDTILDVGCGNGEVLEYIKDSGKKGLGIDICEQTVKLCQKKGLDVINEDVFTFFRNNKTKFDGIICSNVMEYIPGREIYNFVQLCSQHLTSNGIMLYVIHDFSNYKNFTETFWYDLNRIRPYTVEVLEGIFNDVGFKIIASGNGDNNNSSKKTLSINHLKNFNIFALFHKFFRKVVKIISSEIWLKSIQLQDRLIDVLKMQESLCRLLQDNEDKYIVAELLTGKKLKRFQKKNLKKKEKIEKNLVSVQNQVTIGKVK